MKNKPSRIIAFFICLLFTFNQTAFSQIHIESIPAGATRAQNNSFPESFRPPHLRYLRYIPSSGDLEVFLDKGNSDNLTGAAAENATRSALRFFLAGLSLPNSAFWVNLRPEPGTDVMDTSLARTDIGKIFLEADVQLKKDLARFTSPETEAGEEYWNRLYKKADELYAGEKTVIPTITRPWIVPDEVILKESPDSAYVYKATLKVMLEEDYLRESPAFPSGDRRLQQLNAYSSQLIRELILPKLTDEINTAQRYAPLRKVYYALILSQWFKQKLRNTGGTLASRIDSLNLDGADSTAPWSEKTYIDEYRASFAGGEYRIARRGYSRQGPTIRRFASGGIVLTSALTEQDIVYATEMTIIPDFVIRLLCKNLDSHPAITVIREETGDIANTTVVNSLRTAFSDEKANNAMTGMMRRIYAGFGISRETIDGLTGILFHERQGDPRDIEKQLRAYIADRDFARIYGQYEVEKSDRRLALIHDFIRGPLVADIGAGGGELSEAILKEIPGVTKIIATDIDEFRPFTNPAIEFRLQKRPDKLPIETGQIDTVVLSYVLHHVDERFLSPLLNELNRILKNGGRVIILEDTFSGSMEPESQNDLLSDFARLNDAQKKNTLAASDWLGNTVYRGLTMEMPFNFKSMEEWGTYFSRAGFSVENERFLGIPNESFHFASRGVMVFRKTGQADGGANIPGNRLPAGKTGQALAPGGIDLRYMPAAANAWSSILADPKERFLTTKPDTNLLQSEWNVLDRLVHSGCTPSDDRILEYVRLAHYAGVLDRERNRLLLCLCTVLRRQEDTGNRTGAVLKDILTALEAGSK